MADTVKFCSAGTLYLAGAGVSIGATSIVLTTFSDIYGNVLTMTDFGTKGYITLEPETTNAEQATFTGVVANANGTYTLTGIKTSLAKDPYTETSGLVRQHSGGTKVIVTDTAAFWATPADKNNDETVGGIWTFTDPNVPRMNTAHTYGAGEQEYLATKRYVDGVAIAGAAKADSATYGITKLSIDPAVAATPIAVGDNDGRVPTQNENDALVGTSGTAVSASNKLVDNADTSATSSAGKVVRYDGSGKLPDALPTGIKIKFGGTGADGALTSASGVTTIDLGNAAVVIKNYTSISLTGTASIAFTNPNTAGTIIILRSQGDVVLTSATVPLIDTRLMGAAGGAAVSGADGAVGTEATGIIEVGTINYGRPNVTTTGGLAGAALTNLYTQSATSFTNRGTKITAGSGGASGGSAANPSGTGGRGGGALIIECNGALNFTGTINASGTNGGNAGTSDDSGGGGAGAGGMVLVMYNTLTANSGTITNAGGVGGAGGNHGAPTKAGGGGAGSIGAGGAGGNTSNGGVAASGLLSGGGGAGANSGSNLAGGAAGTSNGGLVTPNYWFA